MARGLMISESFVKENSEIDENVDMKLINPTIWLCQKKYIEKVLGTTLFNDILDNIVADTLSADYVTLVDDYIADALLLWVKKELQVPLLFKFRNKSVSKNTDPNSQPVSLDDHKYLVDYYEAEAQYMTERLTAFLCANTATYTLYNTSTEEDDILPTTIKPKVSVHLGKGYPTRDRYGYYTNE